MLAASATALTMSSVCPTSPVARQAGIQHLGVAAALAQVLQTSLCIRKIDRALGTAATAALIALVLSLEQCVAILAKLLVVECFLRQ